MWQKARQLTNSRGLESRGKTSTTRIDNTWCLRWINLSIKATWLSTIKLKMRVSLLNRLQEEPHDHAERILKKEVAQEVRIQPFLRHQLFWRSVQSVAPDVRVVSKRTGRNATTRYKRAKAHEARMRRQKSAPSRGELSWVLTILMDPLLNRSLETTMKA